MEAPARHYAEAPTARLVTRKRPARCSPAWHPLRPPPLLLPRPAPFSPCCSFFSFSCFSIRVALAGSIAGYARNKPPIAGPYSLAMIPATAVIKPPEINRTAYSCHFVWPRTEVSTLTCILISARRTTARTPPLARWAWTRSRPRAPSFAVH